MPPQLSAAVLPETTFGIAARQLLLAEAEVGAGALTVGLVLSITVMVCVAVLVLLALSLAVKVRVIINGLAVEPTPPLFDSDTVTVGVPQVSAAGACEGLAAGTPLKH